MASSYDITLRFDNGQPGYTCHVGESDKPRDADHAVTLAKLNAGAKGWNVKHCDEVFIVAHTGFGREVK